MRNEFRQLSIGIALLCCPIFVYAQVYSPKVITPGQIDTTDLKSLAQSIYHNAHAVTERERAEAIWRFYLTDGRFVKPGMFYHIPGWAYEAPLGEVLDPIKLLNSYGFGLCYQDAPLLQATWDAGGFKHTRAWFLTGHTVAEVFYDGQYHYYDSDMLGYTTVGDGPFKTSPVASVQQLEADRSILLGKLKSPTEVRPGAVDYPWYPADVRAAAVKDIADTFSTADDNYVYGYTRYPHGHTMDFVLRPGERMTRFYNQPDSSVRYLPYQTDGKTWQEFPQDYNESLKVKNGPKSEKDTRRWSTGTIEYRPTVQAARAAQRAAGAPSQAVYAMPSPYVILGAKFSLQASLPSAQQSLTVETSTDAGHTWALASSLHGPFSGEWKSEPKAIAETAHGTLNAVAGSYGYLVRLTLHGPGGDLHQPGGLHQQSDSHQPDITASAKDLLFTTAFEFNPRTLPVIVPGNNVLDYQAGSVVRTELPVHASDAQAFAETFKNAAFHSVAGEGYLENPSGKVGEMIFKLSASGAGDLAGFDAGGRFLDLGDGLAPNKQNAEVRKVAPWPSSPSAPRSASIAWSLKPAGPWTPLWKYDPNIAWADGRTVKHTLRWPEVDRSVRDLHARSGPVYVRYLFQNLAIDDVRLATIERAPSAPSELAVTHRWTQDGKPAEYTEPITGAGPKTYRFDVPGASPIQNQALILAAR